MEIIEIECSQINLKENRELNLCLGFFDGLHIGHRKIISSAVKLGHTGVMTFDVPPSFALGKNTVNSCLTSLYDKNNLLSKLGVEYLYVLRMSKELLEMDKDSFINKILKKINPKSIFVGDDYRFGHNAEGTPEYLSKFFTVKVFDQITENGKKISSHTIRDLVRDGNVKEAAHFLTQNYTINGLIAHGKGNGALIGFKTANLELDFPYVLPKVGVYIGYATLLEKRYRAMICVSTHPTIMELNDPIIEVHILDLDEDLYGRYMDVEFVEFIREIKKFDNIDKLKAQLEKDLEKAKNLLK
ncbi:MAG: riboflavin biosynthesis protein RibF [Bacilli bacterium]|nr:riboflavin biosynthesis protein RibF [Bacilli bacterium]